MDTRATAKVALLGALWLAACQGANSLATDAGPSGGGSGGQGGSGGAGSGGQAGGAPAGGEATGGHTGGAAGGDTGGSTGGATGGSVGGAGGDEPDAFTGPPGDRDDDGVPDAQDNCPRAANHNQEDGDADGAGDVCDNCLGVSNPDQADADGDGAGDVCDLNDDDADGIPGAADNCPVIFNPEQLDRDNDGVGDACDNCAATPNFSQSDDDGDGIGNACEVEGDDDGDGLPDASDNCPRVASADTTDTDNDGVGNVCDNCPGVPNFSQLDSDHDGQGDACDNGDPPDAGAGGDCVGAARRCRPGDASVAELCSGGTWTEAPCAGGEVCEVDRCVPLTCANVTRLDAERGCDFRVTESPNLIYGPTEGNILVPFGIVVSNPGGRPTTVHVRDADDRDMALTARVVVPPPPSGVGQVNETVTSAVYDANGQLVQDQVAQAHGVPIPAGGFARFLLPHPNPAHDFVNSQVRRASWHVTSADPVVVVQHNPACCIGYFSHDAALVPPTALAGRSFRFLGLPTWRADNGVSYPATLTIQPVAAAANVDVAVGGAAVAPAPDTGPRIAENGPRRTVMLDPGDAVNFNSVTNPGDANARPDMSGLAITASAPVSVLSSHVCTQVPHGLFACDHVEEYLPPTDRWGRSFSLVAAPVRNPNTVDDVTYWRIVADRPNTSVTATQDLVDLTNGHALANGATPCTALAAGADRFVLAAGQACELATRAPFGLLASENILVLGHMVGQQVDDVDGLGFAGTGDPASFLASPDEHMTRTGASAVIGTWSSATIQVILPAGARLTHQGQVVNLGAASGIPGTGMVYVELPARAGLLNRLEADVPFRATVFLYGDGLAMAFPLNHAQHLAP